MPRCIFLHLTPPYCITEKYFGSEPTVCFFFFLFVKLSIALSLRVESRLSRHLKSSCCKVKTTVPH